jgi:hypothetical protein
MLRAAAIFASALGLMPAAARAESNVAHVAGVPDHAEAQARGAEGGTGPMGASARMGAPDHAEAQARTVGRYQPPNGLDRIQGVPDHAEAQARGAADARTTE